MSKRRLITALRGGETDIPAWTPFAGIHAAYLLGLPAHRYLRDAHLIARGIVNAAERYRADGIPLVFDLSLEAEALGCDVVWFPDNVPQVVTHPCADRSPSSAGLTLPSLQSGRFPILSLAAKIARPQLDDLDCALMGFAVGPFTLASHLAGIRLLHNIAGNRPKAREMLAFAGEVTAWTVRFYADIGCEVISVLDPLASQLKAGAFRELVTPFCQAGLEIARERGLTSCFFICGDSTKLLEEVCQVGAHGVGVDEQVNLLYVRDMASKYGLGFSGNLRLTMPLNLSMMSPRDDAIVCLASGGNRGYTLAPGCDLLYDTSPDYIEQVVQARDWFHQSYRRYPSF